MNIFEVIQKAKADSRPVRVCPVGQASLAPQLMIFPDGSARICMEVDKLSDFDNGWAALDLDAYQALMLQPGDYDETMSEADVAARNLAKLIEIKQILVSNEKLTKKRLIPIVADIEIPEPDGDAIDYGQKAVKESENSIDKPKAPVDSGDDKKEERTFDAVQDFVVQNIIRENQDICTKLEAIASKGTWSSELMQPVYKLFSGISQKPFKFGNTSGFIGGEGRCCLFVKHGDKEILLDEEAIAERIVRLWQITLFDVGAITEGDVGEPPEETPPSPTLTAVEPAGPAVSKDEPAPAEGSKPDTDEGEELMY